MDFSRDRSSKTVIERAPMGMPKAVVIAAAVGCAFGLGVVSARAAGPDRVVVEDAEDVAVDSKDALARADARTKAYEARVKAATSTWHAQLTTAETIDPIALPTKFKQPAPAEPATETVAAVEAPSSSPTVDTEVVRAVEAVEPDVKKPDVEPAARAKNEDRDEDEGDVATAPKPEKLAAALNKVLGEKPASTTAGDDKRYAVQLASTPKKDAASSIAAGFVQKGFAARVISAEVPGKGTMYRVRVNGFATRAAADSIKARIGQGLVVTDD